MKKDRIVLKIAGESGQGINSVGEMFCKALKNSGLYIFGYREYPSLIQGGFATYQVDISGKRINSSSLYFDIAICLSRLSIHKILENMSEGGMLVHWMQNFKFSEEQKKLIEEKKIEIYFVDAKEIIDKITQDKIMINTFFIGIVWKLFNLNLKSFTEIFIEKFSSKPEILKANIEILKEGFSYHLTAKNKNFDLNIFSGVENKEELLISGNHSLALGAIAAGVRAYYAYPMTPSSSILSYLANTYRKTGMLVKQAEDEITAIQMTIGSMHMGTRALVATSGGGFDLMTESVSLAAMIETPLVCVVAQRPGPATGVPTWSASSDLNLAIYSGHGEYAKCVIATSDAKSCFSVIQNAFNIAEKYQIPVLVLTEKQIAESLFQIEKFQDNIAIDRFLSDPKNVNSNERYSLTENGVSARWLPGQNDQTYIANSDEHFENGRITEDGIEVRKMMDKRLKKLKFLKEDLPEPELFGRDQGNILFVGWGSVKNTLLDLIDKNNEISYLHYEYVFPIKSKFLNKIKSNFKKIVIIENNATGQLADQIKLESGIIFDDSISKYDGRPYFLEEIDEYIKLNI